MTSFAAILLVLLCAALVWTLRNRCISPVLAVALTIYVAFWNAFPFLYSVFMRERLRASLLDSLYYKLAALEFAHVLIPVILLNLFGQHTPASGVHTESSAAEDTSARNRAVALLCGAFLLQLSTHAYSIYKMGYAFIDRVQYAVSDTNRDSALGPALSTLGSFAPPLAMAYLYSQRPLLQNSRWVTLLSLTIMLTQAVFMFAYGMRSATLFPLILAIFYIRERGLRTSRAIKSLILVFTLASVVVGSLLGVSLTSIRTKDSYDVSDLSAASAQTRPKQAEEYGLTVLDETYTKFDGFVTGAALLAAEGESRAGLSLIASSLTSPIPRAILPTKPVPFSSNGEYSGIPYYLVPCLDGTCMPGSVVPVASSAIALWEFGYPSIFLSILCNVANLLFLNVLLKSESLLSRTMAFLLLGVPLFGMLIAPTGWIIKDMSRVLLVLGFARLLASFWRSARESRVSAGARH